MDAAAELEFSELAHATGRALWPGSVRIGGADYVASVSREPVEIALDGRAGIREVEGLRVEIAKDLLPTCPEVETAVKDLADDAVYTVKRSNGHAATDAVWFLVCAKFEN